MTVVLAERRADVARRVLERGTARQKLRVRWLLTARPEQVAPSGAWEVWLILAGRGWGKTRTGAEEIAERARTQPMTRWAVVAATYADARDTCVEGESGLLVALGPDVDTWNRSLGELVLTNGSRIKLFSADEPDRLRGPQHHGAWCDELAAWRRPDAWDQLQFGLRLGRHPQTIVTTTPRPTTLVRQLVQRHHDGDGVIVRRGSTFENADHLAPAALDELRRRYEGTRIGRQELDAELLLDTPGALWTTELLDAHRVHEAPDLVRVVVAIDPAVTSGEDADETGVIAAGVGHDGHVYVLEDCTLRDTPEAWARCAIAAYDRHEGDRIVAEVNNGGDLVASVLRAVDPSVPLRLVHASRGKRVRAEPVAALYEQGKVHHVGRLPVLEDGDAQRPGMTTWVPDHPVSPDRVDALVWAITDLAIEQHGKRRRSVVASGVAA